MEVIEPGHLLQEFLQLLQGCVCCLYARVIVLKKQHKDAQGLVELVLGSLVHAGGKEIRT